MQDVQHDERRLPARAHRSDAAAAPFRHGLQHARVLAHQHDVRRLQLDPPQIPGGEVHGVAGVRGERHPDRDRGVAPARRPSVRQVVDTRSTRTPNRSHRPRRSAVVTGGDAPSRAASARSTSAATVLPSSNACAPPPTATASSVRAIEVGNRARVSTARRTAAVGSAVRARTPERRTPSSHASTHGTSPTSSRASVNGASRPAARCARRAARSSSAWPVTCSSTACSPPIPDRSARVASTSARLRTSVALVTGRPTSADTAWRSSRDSPLSTTRPSARNPRPSRRSRSTCQIRVRAGSASQLVGRLLTRRRPAAAGRPSDGGTGRCRARSGRARLRRSRATARWRGRPTAARW